jgi:hypothetical protein
MPLLRLFAKSTSPENGATPKLAKTNPFFLRVPGLDIQRILQTIQTARAALAQPFTLSQVIAHAGINTNALGSKTEIRSLVFAERFRQRTG